MQLAPALPARFHRDEALVFVTRTAVVAVVAELILLRTLTRTAIHIPGLDRTSLAYRAISESGRLAYYVAVVFLVAALGFLARAYVRRGDGVGAAAVVIFAVAAVAARLGWLTDTGAATAIIGSATLLVAGVIRRSGVRRAMAPALFVLAFGMAALHTVIQMSAPDRLDSAWLLVGAEGAVLAAALAAPLMWRTAVARQPAWIGLGVTAVFYAAVSSNPATAKILLLWNAGLAGYFPTIAYALAAGAVAYALATGHRARDWAGFLGLALLLVGGIGLHSTFQSGVVVVGLAVLGLRASPGEGRSVRPGLARPQIGAHPHPAETASRSGPSS